MKTIRQLKIESILIRSISAIVNKAFGNVASVGYVDVSADTKDAKVQIIFTEDAISQQILSSTIKSKIGKQTELRITPRLKFDFLPQS